MSRRKTLNRRFALIDELRGLAVFCMVFYHAFFTLAVSFKWEVAEDLFRFFEPAEPFFAALFVIISGFCSRLSRSTLKRGLILAAIAVCVTAVTIYLERYGFEVQIYFGILHMLAVSMILTALLMPLIKRIHPIVGATVCFLLFMITLNISDGYIGIFGINYYLPKVLFSNDYLMPLGFHSNSFASADYFPIMPWTFIFLCGAFLGKYGKDNKLPSGFRTRHVPFMAFLGRHALIIYIVHQPVIYLLAYGVIYFLGWSR